MSSYKTVYLVCKQVQVGMCLAFLLLMLHSWAWKGGQLMSMA